jgi:peptidoglycan/xylan/chitin deacetylase (PgdA/CDA1 family)
MLLDEIAVWSDSQTHVRGTHRVMTVDELRSLADRPLVEIGGHTVTHPSLSAQPFNVQLTEIQHNRVDLETVLSRPITTFSYPHGDFTAETIRLLRSANFSCACTVECRPVCSGCDRFRLPRLTVENWSGEEFANRLRSWLSVD